MVRKDDNLLRRLVALAVTLGLVALGLTAISITAGPAAAADRCGTEYTIGTEGAFTVTAQPHSPTQGGTVTYTVTYQYEPGPGNRTVTCWDVLLPAGFVFHGHVTGAIDYDPAVTMVNGRQLLTWRERTIPYAAILSFSFQATVTNAATVGTGHTVDSSLVFLHSGNPAIRVVRDQADVDVRPEPGLELRKAPAPLRLVAGGGQVQPYTLTVTNRRDAPAEGVVLTDRLPPGLTFVDSPDGCTFNSGPRIVTCPAIPALGAGESAHKVIYVKAEASALPGIEVNAAYANAYGFPQATADAQVIIERKFDVRITKVGPRTVFAGAPVTYTLTVTNDGPSDARVTVTDILLSGLNPSGISGESPLTCHLATLTCTGTVPAGQTRQVHVTADSDPGLAPPATLTNRARVQTEGGENSSPPQYRTATWDTKVITAATLTLSKTLVAPHPVVAGGIAEYRLTVGNTGPSVARNVTVTDQLSKYTTFDPVASPHDCAEETLGGVRCRVGDLRPGETADILIVVRVSPGAPESLLNTATATSTTPGRRLQATAITPVTQHSGLTIVKRAEPNPVSPGGPITYTLTITNHGPSDATNVEVTDDPPDSVTFTDARGTGGFDCGISFSPVKCTVDRLPRGAEETITITGDVSPEATPGSSIHNRVDVSADGTLAGGDDVYTTVAVSNALQLTKDVSPRPATAGAPLAYTLRVTNNSAAEATGVVLKDTIPDGFSPDEPLPDGCTRNGSELTCDLRDLAADGDSQAVTIPGTVDPSAAHHSYLPNRATVTDEQGGAAEAPQSVQVVRAPAFTVTKKPLTNPVTAGGTVKWEVTVTNQGPSDFGPPSAPVPVLDASSPYVTVTGMTSEDPGVNCGTAPSCAITSLPAHKDVTIIVTGDVRPDASGTLDNKATIQTPYGDPETGESDPVTVEREARLEVTKSAPATVVAGGTVSYVIQVRNHGPSDTTGTTVTDTLPAGLTFTGEPPCTAEGQHVTCDVGDLAAGTYKTVIISADVSPHAAGTLRNTAVAEADDAPPAKSDETQTEVRTDATVSVSKAAREIGIAGRDLTWTLTVLNQGPSPAAGARITDTLPPGLTFVRAGSGTPGVRCEGSGRSFSCALPDLTAGQQVNIALITRIAPDIIPPGRLSVTVTNRAEVHFDGESRFYEAPAEIKGLAELTASKSARPNPVRAGGEVTFTLGIANHGPSNANHAFIADTLSPGLRFIPARSDPRCGLTATVSGVPVPAETVICRAGTLAPGHTKTFHVTSRVHQRLTSGLFGNVSGVGSETGNLNKSPASRPVFVRIVRPFVPVTG